MSEPAFFSGELEGIFFEALEKDAAGRVRMVEELRSARPELAGPLAALLDADDRNRDGTMETAIAQNFSEQAPRRIGNYAVISLLGEGSVGTVFEARQLSTGRICAVKLLRPGLETPAWRRRFQREAEFLGRLNHSGIAQVYDAGLAVVAYNDGTEATRFYLAMEFVRGVNASVFVRREQPATVRRVELVEQAAIAVHHAHEAGLIHRDLKPDNIMIGESGEVKVVDFGIGRLIENDSNANVTGLLIGTPGFVSPEQLAGMRERVDTRTDVYALGATLYALLAGNPPCVGKDVSLRSLAPAVDRRLEAIVLKSLSPKSENRYSSAAQMADDLRRWKTGEPISARPALLDGVRRWGRQNPRTMWALFAVATLVAGTYLAFEVQPEWRYQARARLLPAPKIPVEMLGFDGAASPPDAAALSSGLAQMFRAEMTAGGLLVERSGPHDAGADRIRPGAIDLLSAQQIATFRSAGVKTILTGDFDVLSNAPWSPVEIRVRLVDTSDGRAVWTAAAQGSTAEFLALVAQLCRGIQENMGGREQTIRRQLQAPPEAERLAEEGLDDLLRFDLVKARIALEQAANRNIASVPIRLRLAHALYDLGYRDLARNEVAGAFRLALNEEDRRNAEALEQELAANWPRAIELRQEGSHGPLQQLSLANDLISDKRFEAADEIIAKQLAVASPSTGRNRWLITRARWLREVPGRHGQLANADRLVEIARRDGPRLFLAESLDKHSEALTFAGRPGPSQEAAAESQEIFAQEGHREGMIREMGILGQRLQIHGSTAEAIRVLERAMRAVEGAGFDDTERYVANVLGQAYGRGYDLDLSRQMLTRAFTLSWKSRDSDQSRAILCRLGITFRDLGQLEEARRALRQAIAPPGAQPDSEARSLNALGETELLAGNSKAALDAVERAEKLSIIAAAEDVRMDARALGARARLMQGDASQLDEIFAAAVANARERGMPGSLAGRQFDWGRSLLMQQNAPAAVDHLRESVKEFERIDRPAFLAQARALLAIALLRTNHPGDAAGEVSAAQSLAKGTAFAYTRVLADYAQACLFAAQGHAAEAGKTADMAIQRAQSFGFKPLAAWMRAQFPGIATRPA